MCHFKCYKRRLHHRFYTSVQLMPCCCLRFQLDTDFFSFDNPVPYPLDPRCQLHVLCICATNICWPKGILGSGAYLKSNLITQIFVFERQTQQFDPYVLGMRGDKWLNY